LAVRSNATRALNLVNAGGESGGESEFLTHDVDEGHFSALSLAVGSNATRAFNLVNAGGESGGESEFSTHDVDEGTSRR
jgi:hypothetical protein